jgi:hypothetical protein
MLSLHCIFIFIFIFIFFIFILLVAPLCLLVLPSAHWVPSAHTCTHFSIVTRIFYEAPCLDYLIDSWSVRVPRVTISWSLMNSSVCALQFQWRDGPTEVSPRYTVLWMSSGTVWRATPCPSYVRVRVRAVSGYCLPYTIVPSAALFMFGKPKPELFYFILIRFILEPACPLVDLAHACKPAHLLIVFGLSGLSLASMRLLHTMLSRVRFGLYLLWCPSIHSLWLFTLAIHSWPNHWLVIDTFVIALLLVIFACA